MSEVSPARHILAGFDGVEVPRVARELILKHKILGFTLFKWNISSVEQLSELTCELKALAKQAGYDILLAVDQEGGRVERLPQPFSRIPPMRRWAEAVGGENSAENFYRLGKILGEEVRLAGFNLDFAPVADVDLNPANPVIGDRAFSADTEIVTRCCREIVRGINDAGVIGCLKHFPGHGATAHDSHEMLPTDARPAVEIFATDLVPYRRLIAENFAPSIMTAHVVYPELDPDNPATLSQKILTGILRQGLNYAGVVFSDDLTMKAIANHHDLALAAEKFFLAGGDAVLICKKPELSLEVIGKLSARTASPAGAKLRQSLVAAVRRLEHLVKSVMVTEPAKRDFTATLKEHQQWLKQLFPA